PWAGSVLSGGGAPPPPPRLPPHASELHFHHPVSGKAIAARQPSPF
ncbi:RluA family pseudouridine synthase, partial [Klebsiella aerogenes]